MQKVICDICEKKAADKHFKVKKEIETKIHSPSKEWTNIYYQEDEK